jgi:hypothetical protein
MPGGYGVAADLARLRSEQEADGEEHDLGQPPGTSRDQQRRSADIVRYVVVPVAEPNPVPEPLRQPLGPA